ncbi:hypothetical protein KAR48_01715 [bacterium]|nr:hypothetical protein [bacterium]
MSIQFTKSDFECISDVLDADFVVEECCYRLVLDNKKDQRRLVLEIYPDISIGEKKGNLISVYTNSSHLQLHFCSGFVVSKMLGEVTFVSDEGSHLSGLIIEKGAACNVYANVDPKILSGDFTRLGPEVMLSGIALSLTEDILHEQENGTASK